MALHGSGGVGGGSVILRRRVCDSKAQGFLALALQQPGVWALLWFRPLPIA